MAQRTRPQKSKRSKGTNGRTTTSASEKRRVSGRYTEPIPTTERRSPKWYPWMLMTLLIGGVGTIILNYVQILWNSPSNWYTLGGLIAIVLGALAATRYR